MSNYRKCAFHIRNPSGFGIGPKRGYPGFILQRKFVKLFRHRMLYIANNPAAFSAVQYLSILYCNSHFLKIRAGFLNSIAKSTLHIRIFHEFGQTAG